MTEISNFPNGRALQRRHEDIDKLIVIIVETALSLRFSLRANAHMRSFARTLPSASWPGLELSLASEILVIKELHINAIITSLRTQIWADHSLAEACA